MAMKRNLISLYLVFLVAFPVTTVIGGQYSPDFDFYLAEHESETMVSATVAMVDRVDLEALKSELYARRADRRDWHETVVRALQDKATESQAGILAELAVLSSQGLVEDYRGVWIANLVLVTATREALDILVQRDDVRQIEPDYPIEGIKPVAEGEDEGLIAGVENGLRAIRADEVWDMGYTGGGRLVSHLDTGVYGDHPALNARWRGYDPRYSENPEWAWFDPVTNTDFPFDSGQHGTHTMGTICGLGESTGDTIGVAFGAEWITAGVIDRGGIDQTVANAILSFQWIADPDEDPGTVWDVPDVNSNSWGVGTWHGYEHCDPIFWDVLDGCEAASVFVVFAAGNEGPTSRSLRNPATRAATDIKSFAVGALDGNSAPNYPIASFSSRGPTECTPGGEDTFKPEVSAPGVNVRSSIPGGGYAGGWSGTSMACPHVAGVVALMREANPNLTTDQIGEILLETAVEVPADNEEGEDNTYGMGMVDAYEAVILSLAYLEGWGTLAGYITDQASGDPIQGATVSVMDRPWSATSNGAGYYRLFMPADTLWDIKVENPPTHLPVFDQQMVAEGETLFVDYELEGKVAVTLRASFANPEDVSYRSFYLKGSWDNDGFYDETWSGDLVEIRDDGQAPDETAEDGVFTGEVLLARDEVNTYSWAIYSENYGGEEAHLDDGADFDILDLDPPDVPTLVVNPSGSDNNWIISVEGDNGLSLDLMQGIDNNPNKWGAATDLEEGITYTFRFKVMHSEVASYGSGGIGGADLQFTCEFSGAYDFIFNDSDDSYLVQLTGTEGPPAYLSAQSGLDGHIPVSWLPPGTQESQEMYYDDGVLVNAYYFYSHLNLSATMFVPESYPLVIDSAVIHVLTDGDPYWPWPNDTHEPVGISIFLDDGSGNPENDPVFYTEAAAELGEWLRVDVDEVLVSSGNFWVAMNNLVDLGNPPAPGEGLGLDAVLDYPGNQWVRLDGIWQLQPWYDGDHMIRAKVFAGGRLDWMGYDSSPAYEVAPNVPVFIDPSSTAAISGPTEIENAVNSRLSFDRTAYHPNLSRTYPPMGSDTQVLAGYNLYRDVVSAPFDRDMQINEELIEETHYDDWGNDPDGPIVNGTTYFYQASAVYDIGGGEFVEVGPSNEASATPINHPPADPENLVGYSYIDTVFLDWSPNTDYDIAQYRIYRRNYGENDFNLVGTVDHPDTSFFETLELDGIYRYKIAAVDAEGMQSEGYSNSVDVPIGAIPPRQLTATTTLDSRIDLEWRNPGLRPLDPQQNYNVAVLISDYAGAEQEVVDFLLASGEIESADFIDAQNQTPNLEDLEPYDAVVTWSNYQYQDATGIGNVLADYIDLGKGVVVLEFSFYDGWAMQGRFMSEYSPYAQASSGYVDVSLGDYDEGHPLMEDVSNVTDYFVHDVTLTGVGEAVAWWSNNWPFVAYNIDNQLAVGINGYVGIPDRRWTGDMLQVLLNSVVFVAGGAGIEPDNYRVYKSESPSGPFDMIAELPGTQTTYTDEPVPNNVDYYYYVTAFYQPDEESDPTNVAMGRAVEGAGMVIVPTSFEVTAQPGDIVTENMNISNPGGLDLTFSISVSENRIRGDEDPGGDLEISEVPANDNNLLVPSAPATDPDGSHGSYSGAPFDPHAFEHVSSGDDSGDEGILVPQVSVLVIASDGASLYMNELLSFDDITGVDYYDAGSGTPSLDQLMDYEAVVVWSNYVFYDPVGMGDVLADYADNGGGVVLHQFCFGSGWNLDGRMMNEYCPLSPGSISYTNHSLGDFDDSSPLMQDVTYVSDFYMSYVSLINDGQWVASYDDGTPFVAINPDNHVVAINGYVGDFRQFAGDMILLSYNSVIFSTEGRWLSVDPRNGVVEPGSDMDVDVIVDATDLEEGTYNGILTVTGFDINHQVDQIEVPVTLFVVTTGIDDEIGGLPTEFSLSQNYPNPFNPATEIQFALPENAHVKIEIFNVLGQKVHTLVNEDMEAGYKSVTWNGLDDSGKNVSSGVYLYRMEAGDRVFNKKMLMLK
jgi:subtilisin family serine protease